MNLATFEQMIIDKHNEVMNKARSLFPQFTHCGDVKVKFIDKGMTAGLAYGYERIEYNTQIMIQKPSLVDIIIPHEIAHVVCSFTGMGRQHNKGWKRVCLMLGGDGNSTVSCPDIKINARRQTRYVYKTNSGHIVHLSATRHNKLVQKKVMAYMVNNEYITPVHFTGQRA